MLSKSGSWSWISGSSLGPLIMVFPTPWTLCIYLDFLSFLLSFSFSAKTLHSNLPHPCQNPERKGGQFSTVDSSKAMTHHFLLLLWFSLALKYKTKQRLTEFCQQNTLVIANTPFQQHKRQLYIWTSPDSQYWNQIDYIFCSWRWRSSIQSVKTRPRPDCDSDHELLFAKFRLKLKKVGKNTRPFMYDLNQILMIIQWRWWIDSGD